MSRIRLDSILEYLAKRVESGETSATKQLFQVSSGVVDTSDFFMKVTVTKEDPALCRIARCGLAYCGRI